MFSVPLLQNDGKAGPKCSSVLLGKSFPNDPGSEAEEKEGVGIGSLYEDTLMRSFRGNTSNHQPHIKLSSLPIASQVLVFFLLEEVGSSLPSPWSFSNGYFGSTPKVHRLWVHCFYRPLSHHLLAAATMKELFKSKSFFPSATNLFFGWYEFLI